MAPRANWKGFLKLAQVVCPVKIYGATAEADKQKFTAVNPETGNKLDFQRVDSVTGAKVEFKDMAKGVEVGTGAYAIVSGRAVRDRPGAISGSQRTGRQSASCGLRYPGIPRSQSCW